MHISVYFSHTQRIYPMSAPPPPPPHFPQCPPAVIWHMATVNSYVSPVRQALPHALAETTTSSMATSARVSHAPFFLPVSTQLVCLYDSSPSSLTHFKDTIPMFFTFFLSSAPLPSLKIFNLSYLSPSFFPSPPPSPLLSPIRSKPSCLHLLWNNSGSISSYPDYTLTTLEAINWKALL